MPYRDEAAHRKALSKALLELHDERGISWPSLHKAYAKAMEDGKVPSLDKNTRAVSRPTLTSYSIYGENRIIEGAKSVFNFLESSPDYQTRHINSSAINAGEDERADIIYAMAKFYNVKQGQPSASLHNLAGSEFALFCPVKPGEKGEFYVRSIVSFTKQKSTDLYEYAEVLTIDDVTHYGGPLSENYEGFVFQCDETLIVFARNVRTHHLKILIIHRIEPSISGKRPVNVSVNVMYGTMVYIDGPGPHRSSKVMFRRIQDNHKECSVIEHGNLDVLGKLYYT